MTSLGANRCNLVTTRGLEAKARQLLTGRGLGKFFVRAIPRVAPRKSVSLISEMYREAKLRGCFSVLKIINGHNRNLCISNLEIHPIKKKSLKGNSSKFASKVAALQKFTWQVLPHRHGNIYIFGILQMKISHSTFTIFLSYLPHLPNGTVQSLSIY